MGADVRRLLERERLRGRWSEVRLAGRIGFDLVRAGLAERSTAFRATSSDKTYLRRERRRERRMLQELGSDFRDALRFLRRHPAYAAAVVATLALGIGATAAIFVVVEAAILRPLPFDRPDRLVLLWESNPQRDWAAAQVAPANLLDWQQRSRSFSGVAAFSDWFEQQTLSAPGEPEPIRTMKVMGDLFGVLGVRPVLGRALRPEETWSGGEKVAVLAHGFWQRRFAADPQIIGRRIEIDREPVTVVGVMPAGFSLWSDETDLWRPFGFAPEMR